MLRRNWRFAIIDAATDKDRDMEKTPADRKPPYRDVADTLPPRQVLFPAQIVPRRSSLGGA